MGNFFTSTQIYNSDAADKDKFIDTFCKAMKTAGYVTCDGEEAEKSYILKFADNCKWVTITSEEYGEGNQTALSDTGRIAKMLKTSCVNTTVIDSDCAVMEMYSKSGKKADTLIMGRADDYFGDDISLPSEKVWKPFLAEGMTWEQLCNILNNSENYTFVEDCLSELAPLIGMDDSNILFSAEDADEDEQTVFLGFKKAEAKEKKLTFISAFKLIFGEMLEPMGYKYLKKGKYPYFVKVINNEILHIISYRHVSSSIVGHKAMEIHGGAISLYRREIDLTDEPTYFLPQIRRYYNGPWGKLADELWGYECNMSDNESLTKDMKRAAELVKEYILSVIADVTDIESYVKYAKSFHCIDTDLCELDEYENNQRTGYNESYLLVLTYDDDDDGIKRMEDYINSQLNNMSPVISNNPEKLKERETEIREQENNDRLEYIALRDRLINDKESFRRIEEILQKNRANNLEMLEELGLISKKAEAKEKKLTLNDAFTQIFGEALEPLGFKRIKGRNLYFARVMNGDILHILGICDMTTHIYGFGGITTLYNTPKQLGITQSYRANDYWLMPTKEIYEIIGNNSGEELDPRSYTGYYYRKDDTDSIIEALKDILLESKKWVLPFLDKVTNIHEFFDFKSKTLSCEISLPPLPLPIDEKTDYAIQFLFDDPLEKLKEYFDEREKAYAESYESLVNKTSPETIMRIQNRRKRNKENSLNTMQAFVSDEILKKQTLEELENRRKANIEILKKYGINIYKQQ